MSNVTPLQPSANGYRVVNKGETAEIFIYTPIGDSLWSAGLSADQFRKDLRALGNPKVLQVRINSPGGDVFDGSTIYQLLKDHRAEKRVMIDGLAASAASFIAMAGDQISMGDAAMLMIHQAHGFTLGPAEAHEENARLLRKIDGMITDLYERRTRQPRDQIVQWMKDETWMTAKEALDRKFVDAISEAPAVAACVIGPLKNGRDPPYRHIPAAFRPRRAAALARLQGGTHRM